MFRGKSSVFEQFLVARTFKPSVSIGATTEYRATLVHLIKTCQNLLWNEANNKEYCCYSDTQEVRNQELTSYFEMLIFFNSEIILNFILLRAKFPHSFILHYACRSLLTENNHKNNAIAMGLCAVFVVS